MSLLCKQADSRTIQKEKKNRATYVGKDATRRGMQRTYIDIHFDHFASNRSQCPHSSFTFWRRRAADTVIDLEAKRSQPSAIITCHALDWERKAQIVSPLSPGSSGPRLHYGLFYWPFPTRKRRLKYRRLPILACSDGQSTERLVLEL